MCVDDGVPKKFGRLIGRYPDLRGNLICHDGVCIRRRENIKTAGVIAAFAAHIQISNQVRRIESEINISFAHIGKSGHPLRGREHFFIRIVQSIRRQCMAKVFHIAKMP